MENILQTCNHTKKLYTKSSVWVCVCFFEEDLGLLVFAGEHLGLSENVRVCCLLENI